MRLQRCAPCCVVRQWRLYSSSSSSSTPSTGPVFRQQFQLHDSFNRFDWFPRHMYSGVKKMEAKLRKCDCVVEVHDARIPFSGRNTQVFRPFYRIKPHLLVLNKSDLIDVGQREFIEHRLKVADGVTDVMWTNFQKRGPVSAKRVTEKIVDMVTSSERYHRSEVNEYECLVVGIPNVGKSTLINQLRVQLVQLNSGDGDRLSRRKSKGPLVVGDMPGVTKAVHQRMRVSAEPDIFLLDTPGVLPPTRSDPETIMKMAVCRCVAEGSEHRTQAVADYLLYWLNRQQRFDYVQAFQLEQATDSIETLLLAICIQHNYHVKRVLPGQGTVVVPDFYRASTTFLSAFRKNKLGKQFMDTDYL